MKKQSLTKKLHNSVHPTISLIVLIGAISLTALIVILLLQDSSPSFSPLSRVKYKKAISTSTSTPIPTILPPKTFTSPDLGISFAYYNAGTIQVKEIGNKIYVYATYQIPQEGKYIEVLPKASTDSLSQAMQKRFLQGKPENQCSVEPLDYLRDQYVVKTYEFAEIKTHVPQNTDFNTGRQAEEQCSPIYATSQTAYFLMDPAHPDLFLFINIGQDNFSGPPSNPNLTWEETIRFIGK